MQPREGKEHWKSIIEYHWSHIGALERDIARMTKPIDELLKEFPPGTDELRQAMIQRSETDQCLAKGYQETLQRRAAMTINDIVRRDFIDLVTFPLSTRRQFSSKADWLAWQRELINEIPASIADIPPLLLETLVVLTRRSQGRVGEMPIARKVKLLEALREPGLIQCLQQIEDKNPIAQKYRPPIAQTHNTDRKRKKMCDDG